MNRYQLVDGSAIIKDEEIEYVPDSGSSLHPLIRRYEKKSGQQIMVSVIQCKYCRTWTLGFEKYCESCGAPINMWGGS